MVQFCNCINSAFAINTLINTISVDVQMSNVQRTGIMIDERRRMRIASAFWRPRNKKKWNHSIETEATKNERTT